MSVCDGDTASAGPFYRDSCFWAAVVIGVLASWMLFLALGGVRIAGLGGGSYQQLLWLILLYPLMEEVIFRAGIQAWLLQSGWGGLRLSGVTAANALTSLAFMCAHLIYHPPLWAMAVYLPSLLFGWFYERYNSVIPAIALHCLYNLSYFTIFGVKL